MSSVPTNAAADKEFVIRHSMLKGYQAFSLLTPPLYTAVTLFRRGRQGFAINRMLRATWVGGGIGTAIGGAMAWARLRSQLPESIHDRRIRLLYNVSQIRTDDHSTIGSILFAVLTPALLWNRASAMNLILGGAGIGSGVGVLVHVARSFSEGEDLKPEGMIEEVKEVSR
ncbi:hypothetical protein BU17DRAFT_44979 [Hysterangium stoloniferum]|nr:hypothetical protein BU17DRAFT_44979 [Hysterangium stoloniferum]